MAQKVNICILGCGSVAKLHATIAKTLKKNINLLFASRDFTRATAYNAKYKGHGAFGSYEEACTSANVDAIFICTPHAYHLEHTRLAAGGKKAILIEKPVTRTLEELATLQAVVENAGVVCMVAENYFFKPLAKKVCDIIKRGDIGEPLFIELNRANRSNVKGWRADAEMMGGGALLEGGVHWINLICSLGGDVREVLAVQPAKSYAKVAPFEDSLELLFKFADGSIGKMLHSWNVTNRIFGLGLSKIHGTEGNIHFESNGVFALLLGTRKRIYMPNLIDIMGYRGMLQHFAECVRENKEPKMSLAVARRDMEIVFAAYRSMESGQFEKLI